MDILVIHNHVSPVRDTRKKTHVGVESGIEEQSGLGVEELAQAMFELGVGGAVDEETRAG